MNRKINKYYFDINSEANYIFLNVKMVCIICCPIQYVHIFRVPPNAREYPNRVDSRNGINAVKNGFLFYGRVSCEDNKCVPSHEHYSHLHIGFQSSMDTLYFMNNGAVIHFFLKKKRGKKEIERIRFYTSQQADRNGMHVEIISIIPLIKIFLFIGKGQVVFIIKLCHTKFLFQRKALRYESL